MTPIRKDSNVRSFKVEQTPQNYSEANTAKHTPGQTFLGKRRFFSGIVA